MTILDRALRMGEGKKFKEFQKRVAKINDFEPELELDSDEELQQRADELSERAKEGDDLDELLPESFALTREAARRSLGQRHFDVQLIGGMVLHDGSIAEMRTGEGKTLTATLPAVLNALAGTGVHVVTVNDYLARRDAEWMRPVYEALGLTVGILQAGEQDEAKHAAYAADITYGTNSEFGFDYLRDNLAITVEDKYQRGHGYAIVDEVDNILIDEARTPLIISGQPEQAADLYYKFAKLAPRLEAGKKPEGPEAKSKDYVADFDYEPDEKHKTVAITERGVEKAGEVPRHREHVPRRARQPRQPPDPVAQGGVALQARRGLRGDRRRGEDHRRVHRPHPRGPALVRGPPPGDRGEGGRRDPGGEPDRRDDHLPELLPQVRQARGHDRHGPHRGHRVHEDLRAAGGRGAHQPADGPQGPQRPGLQDQGRQVAGRRARDPGAPRQGPAGARRHDLGGGLGAPVRAAEEGRHRRTPS